jgi:hypothetical protein
LSFSSNRLLPGDSASYRHCFYMPEERVGHLIGEGLADLEPALQAA